MKPKTPAVFLDRDGVLNEDLGYAYKVTDLKLIEGSGPALKKLQAMGYLLIVISNQSGVARGLFKLEDVIRFNQALAEKLQNDFGVAIDDFYVCPHLPDGTVKEYAKSCECRKPGTKLIKDAAAKHGIDLTKSFFVGDRSSDIECAVKMNVVAIQMQTHHKSDERAKIHVKKWDEVVDFIKGFKAGN